MTILPLTSTKLNIQSLSELAQNAFSGSEDVDINKWFSFEYMLKQIDEGYGICLVSQGDDDKLLGYIYAQRENPINGLEGNEKWVIVITAVAPQSSGSGIGSALLSAIGKVAKDNGAVKMFVYTNETDHKVIHFYHENGFVDAGRIKDYQYGHNNSPVFMLKYL